MNTPEQAGATLARDMIALVESHYLDRDARLIFISGLHHAVLKTQAYIYEDNPGEHLKHHMVFIKTIMPYVHDLAKS
jgi:hypothetical protein